MPTYINYYLYETRNYVTGEPIKVMTQKGPIDFLSYTVLPVVLKADTNKYSYLSYDISNPNSADAVFGGLDPIFSIIVVCFLSKTGQHN